MKHINFIIKAASIVIVIACLLFYQTKAQAGSAKVAENEAAIAELESYNQEIRRQMEEDAKAASGEEVEEEEGPYANGTFEGQGTGYGGLITVSVEIDGGFIQSINVLDHSTEDPAYYMLAETIVPQMENAQSADVDTVSGATLSSTGLIQAVSEALSKAAK